MTILILSILFGVTTSSAEVHEFNVKQLLRAQESENRSSPPGILEELKKLICGLDSLLTDIEVPADRQWERDLFKPLMTIKAGAGTGPVIENGSGKESIPLILTGTAMSGDKAIAIFGKCVVGTGEVIDGYRIISIEIGKVVVESEKGRREILIINGEK